LSPDQPATAVHRISDRRLLSKDGAVVNVDCRFDRSLAQKTVEVILPAPGAFFRSAGSQRLFPLMLTFPAREPALFVNHFVISAIDFNGFSIDQRIGHCLPGLVEDPAERRPRDPHALPGIFVRQPIQVGKPERFPFIHSNAHLIKVKHGDAAWLKKTNFRIECHESVFSGSSHEPSIKA